MSSILVIERNKKTTMERTDNEKIKAIEKALKDGERLNRDQAFDLMEKATAENKELAMVWKIPNKVYKEWYDKNKQYLKTTLEEETTYLVFSGNKAFKPHCIGYSIFAESLGSLKRQPELIELDRIEHYNCEFAIIVNF